MASTQKTGKSIVVEAYGNVKVYFEPINLNDSSDGVLETIWEKFVDGVKKSLELSNESSFLFVKSDDKQVDNGADLRDFLNKRNKKNKKKSYVLKLRCLAMINNAEKVTWCPKRSDTPNFRNELDGEDWDEHFGDLKGQFGVPNENGFFQDDEEKTEIRSGDDLKRVWEDRYNDMDKCWLSLKVIDNEMEETKQEERKSFSQNNEQKKEEEEGKEEEGSDTTEKKYFDIAKMLELTKKADEAAKAIKDKDVILFLGGTGTGKSTLIHFLAGSELERKTVDNRLHIVPTKIKNKALSNIVTSADAVSATQYITPVPIDLEKMGVTTEMKTVVLCDTPGFEDTNGPEVDVANGIGIIRALQHCKRVKPVVVISAEALGYRLNEKKYIHTQAKDAYKSVKNEQDQGYKFILKDIVQKTKKEVFAPDILKDKPTELLEKFCDIKHFIKNPQDVFQLFLTNKSEKAVNLQVQQHKSNILSAFKNNNFKLLKSNWTNSNNLIGVQYKECVTHLTREWNEKCEESKCSFNKCMISAHNISKEDVMLYKQTIDKFHEADELRVHLTDTVSSNSLSQNLTDQVTMLANSIWNNTDNPNELKIQLDKFAHIQACFTEFEVYYKEICEKLAKSLMSYVGNAKECIQKDSFEELRKQLQVIAKNSILQENLASLLDIQKKLTNLVELLMDHLDKSADQGRMMLKKSSEGDLSSNKDEKDEQDEKNEKVENLSPIQVQTLDKNEINILKKIIETLEFAMITFELPCETISLGGRTKDLFNSFINEVVAYFSKIGQKITSVFKKQRYYAFDEIKGFVRVMKDLQKIKEWSKEHINCIITLMIKYSDSSFDYNRFFDCINCVCQSNWTKEQEEGRNDLMEIIKERLLAYFDELQQSCQYLEMDLDHPEHFEQGHKIVTHLEKLRRLEQIIPEIVNYRRDISTRLECAIRSTLTTIKHEYSLEKKNVRFQEKTKEYLQKNFQSVQELDNQIHSIQEELKKHKNPPEERVTLTSKQQMKTRQMRALVLPQSDSESAVEHSDEEESSGQRDVSQLKQKRQIETLHRSLQEKEQVKKEYEELKQKGKQSFEVASEFLRKNNNFSENDITRLVTNKVALLEKISICERDLERSRLNLGYNLDTLNGPRTEKVLRYLKECKAMSFPTELPSYGRRVTESKNNKDNDKDKDEKQVEATRETMVQTTTSLKQELASTLQTVEQYLQHYSEMVEKQLKNVDFAEETIQSEEDKTRILERVEVIVSRLNEVKKLEKSSAMTYSYFSQDMMEHFHIRLRQTWVNLSEEMMQLARETIVQPLKIKLFIVKALSSLDEYSRLDCKFRDLFMKYQEKLYNNVIETKSGDSQAAKVFDEVKHSLSRSLKDVAKTTFTKALLLEENTIQLDQHKAIVEKWIDAVLNRVDVFINSQNFLEAENNIAMARKAIQLLGEHFTQNSFEQTKQQDDHDEKKSIAIVNANINIFQRVDELSKRIEQKLQEIVKHFKTIELANRQSNPYFSNPPSDLYLKLTAVMLMKTFYKQAWDDIQTDITQKIRDQLKQIRDRIGTLLPEQLAREFRLCESVLKSLPKHMQELGEEVQRCKEEIQDELDNSIKAVKEVIEIKDADRIDDLLNQCKQTNQEKHIKTSVDHLARDMMSTIRKKCSDKDLSGAFHCLKELLQFKMKLESKIPQLTKYFTDSRVHVVELFEAPQQKLVTTFGRYIDINANAIEWMAQALDMLIEWKECQSKLTSIIETAELLPTNFDDRMKEVEKAIYQYFVSIEQRYKHGINNMDVDEIRTALDVMQVIGNDTNVFLGKINIFMRNNNAGLNANFKTYSDMLMDLDLQLKNMTEEIVDKGIINDKTKTNDTARNRYFKALKGQLDFLRHLVQQQQQQQQSKPHLHNCKQLVDEQMKKIEKHLKWSPTDCDNINLCYNCFLSMQKNLILTNVVKLQLENLERLVLERAQQLQREAVNNLQAENVIPKLIAMKIMSVHIFSFKDVINKNIDEVLGLYKEENKGGICIPKLALQLEKNRTGIGEMIVAEHA
ncbi:hypothetical protein RFI_25326, partial [Reticulomyxa filosa]